jgi:two-component system chemotaxis sensor kinase CheA
MDAKKEEFRKRLLDTFRAEAAEHIQALSSGLIELEKSSLSGDHPQTLEAIFREAHSLKGAARAVNAAEIESVCQSLESVFSAWQHKEILPNAPFFDLLHRAMDFLEKILLALEAGSGPDARKESGERLNPTGLIASLELARHGGLLAPGPEHTVADSAPSAPPSPEPERAQPPVQPASQPTARSAASDTIRLPAARVSALLLEAEELLIAKLASRHRAAEAEDIYSLFVPWKKTRVQLRFLLRAFMKSTEGIGLRPDAAIPNGKEHAHMRKIVELQELEENFFQSLDVRFEAFAKSVLRDCRSLERMADRFFDSTRKVVMLPAAYMLESFPKLARDLAHDRGKLVTLEVEGADLEMDRRILEEMREPLLHLVRNAIDHGIESPAERLLANKPEQGSLRIALRRKESNKAELLVSDDGKGIHTAQVRAAAQKMGILPPGEDRPPEERDPRNEWELIFRSGVSTSPIITDISGRGLGLAIVREKVEKLGGAVSIESRPGEGTTFRMILPFTRAAFRGVVARVDEQIFVFPSMQVERVLRFRPEDVKTVENRETLVVEGRATALARLGDALAIPARKAADEKASGHAVLIGNADQRIALRVDEVIDEQEVLAKPLGKQLAGVRNVAGAAVLGSGRLVPILDVADLLISAAEAGAAPRLVPTPAKGPEHEKRSILVAEDSITSRSLLKNILETAGYEVRTAVDGAEAFATLKTENFDLLVSDVDMPRLNGFGLTAKVRGDARLAGLPVVLVTALSTREDRERGIDAGANAYIVKSSFDQSNLLEVIRRLL